MTTCPHFKQPISPQNLVIFSTPSPPSLRARAYTAYNINIVSLRSVSGYSPDYRVSWPLTQSDRVLGKDSETRAQELRTWHAAALRRPPRGFDTTAKRVAWPLALAISNCCPDEEAWT